MEASSPAPHIVLVHGLGRSRYDMFLLSRRLTNLLPRSRIHVFEYPSRRIRIEQAATLLNEFIASNCEGGPVSLVGHSLGGIVTRALDLQGSTAAPLHRLVTLGSPHNGASIARLCNRFAPTRLIFGPVLGELGSLAMSSQSRQLEVGCVIGSLNSKWGFVPLFGEDNDGLVLVREAELPTSKETVYRPIFHGLFPFSSEAATLAARFLQHGTFSVGN